MNTSNTQHNITICCGNCHFFKPWSPSHPGLQSTYGNHGLCRRHAPTDSNPHSKKWPEVAIDDCCGEHPGHQAANAVNQKFVVWFLEALKATDQPKPPTASAPSQPVWMNTGR